MPQLVRLYIQNVAIGFGLAALFVGALLALDVAGLRHLVLGSSMGWLAGGMIFVFSGTIFAGVQFGIAVMALAEGDDTPRGGLRQHGDLIPVRVEARASRHSRR